MELSLMGLEVDGGLSNPIVLQAMGIWLGMLLLLLLPLAVYLARRNVLRRPWLWAGALTVVLILPTQLARVVIGTWLYQQGNPNIISVGFWGGASPLLVPLITTACCFIAYRRSRVTVA